MNTLLLKARAMAAFKQALDLNGGEATPQQAAEFTTMISELETERQKEGADVEYIDSLIVKLS